ncbi:hypothetical protein [Pontibacter sp. SGAir0037]|uniref:hypothetical protein n=1 Tax=Pontibacter sp. SGAir0037 TaxID=2571030 RepID=UPI0010CD57B3|nr:hypothetical protein [Pontibacter sp. SGAir0037]QCR21423.1 hypothetical protein C1N53_03030 [Pontibacter sp. SGAir0037]
MKNLITISLLVVMLLQVFSKVFIVVDYEANRAYITEMFCINKDKPELSCEGSCYLKKKLRHADEADDHAAEHSQKQAFQVTLYYQPLFQLNPYLAESVQLFGSAYKAARADKRPGSVFRPPQFTV